MYLGKNGIFVGFSLLVSGLSAATLLDSRLRTLSPLSPRNETFPANQTRPSRYLFVTGDSYTTTGFDPNGTLPSVGNPFGNPPYPGDTLVGGENWVDVLVKNYLPNGTVAFNFALGSRPVNLTRVGEDPSYISGPVKDMIGEVAELERLVQDGKIPYADAENTLSLNWFGINDISITGGLFFNSDQGLNMSQLKQVLEVDIQDYFNQLERIYLLGPRKFVTFLLPPLARTSFYGNSNSTGANKTRNLTSTWNDLIETQNLAFQARHSDLVSVIFDPSPTFNYVLDNYSQFGAPNNTCSSYPDGTPCLWHDFIHPGLAISKELGKAVFDYLEPIGLV